jgi:murein DD-endopeptidase MepM/ murein hydrolase activator NlpD
MAAKSRVEPSERSPRPSRILRTLLVAGAVLGPGLAFYAWRQSQRVEPEVFGDRSWVTIVAGDGVADVRDGPSRSARFSDPFGVAVAADGSIYVADAGRAQRIRRIAPDGTVTTVAGGEPGYQDGPASTARFDTPSGLAVDASGGVLVADTGNDAIRRIAPDGRITTVAGDGTPGDRDGAAGHARFRGPTGIAVDARGRIIVADTYNDRIRAIHPDGTVSTIAGTGIPGLADGPAAVSAFDTPSGVAVDPALNIYIADSGNVAIRKISPDGHVTSIPHDGLVRPTSVAIAPDGVIYAAGDHRVVAVDPDGDIRVVAGSMAGFADGWGEDARFRGLSGIVPVSQAELVVADSVNALVRRIRLAPDAVSSLPAAPLLLEPAFQAGAFGLLPLLWPFAPQPGPFEITATFGEPRGGAADPRFHAGLDISAPAGTSVLAVRDGVVAQLDGVSAFDTINEAIRVGPIAYVHLRVGRDAAGRPFDEGRFVSTRDEDGRLTRMRVRRGARFRTGDRLGTVNAFNHSHIDVGWAGEERNPLQFRLTHFRDTTPPVIARSGVRLFAEGGEPLTVAERGRLIVDGQVEVVVDAWDQVDGNAARRRLGLYSIGYQVLHPDQSPAPGFATPRQTIVFDRLPGEEAASLLFADGSGIREYGNRAARFLYRATNTFRNGVAAPGRWDTRTLPPGDYILRMWVADISGNVATGNRDVAVTIRPPESAKWKVETGKWKVESGK